MCSISLIKMNYMSYIYIYKIKCNMGYIPSQALLLCFPVCLHSI